MLGGSDVASFVNRWASTYTPSALSFSHISCSSSGRSLILRHYTNTIGEKDFNLMCTTHTTSEWMLRETTVLPRATPIDAKTSSKAELFCCCFKSDPFEPNQNWAKRRRCRSRRHRCVAEEKKTHTSSAQRHDRNSLSLCATRLTCSHDTHSLASRNSYAENAA